MITIIAMGNKCISVFLEVLAAIFLILSFYPVMRYGSLAGIQVPQHYSNGCADIWTTRVIFIYLGLIGIAIYSFISVCQSHPNMVNIPFSSKMSVQDRASLASSIARLLKVWCMAQFAFLSMASYRSYRNAHPSGTSYSICGHSRCSFLYPDGVIRF